MPAQKKPSLEAFSIVPYLSRIKDLQFVMDNHKVLRWLLIILENQNLLIQIDFISIRIWSPDDSNVVTVPIKVLNKYLTIYGHRFKTGFNVLFKVENIFFVSKRHFEIQQRVIKLFGRIRSISFYDFSSYIIFDFNLVTISSN